MTLTGMMTGQAPLLPLLRNPLLVPALSLAGALLLGALIIALLNRWRRRAGVERLTPGEQLSQFRSLYEQGAISREEFERLRALLGEQLYQSVVGPARPPGKGAKAGGPPEAAGPPPPGPPDGIRPA